MTAVSRTVVFSHKQPNPFHRSSLPHSRYSAMNQKFSYRFLREENRDGLPCLVVERTPRDTWSGYTRQIMWVDRDESLIRRIDYYDRKGSLLKTYTAGKFRQYGNHWRPSEMLMVNHQTGKQTRLLWTEYRFASGLKDEQFSQNALQRVK